jgi:hydrogenase maturation protease
MEKRFKDLAQVRPPAKKKPVKTLILGMGNPILGDDSVGLRVAESLKAKINSPDITVSTTELGGINLLEVLAGYDRAVVIDAIVTRHEKLGHISLLSPESLAGTRHTGSTHNFDLATTIELGNKLGLELPGEISIFAIEIADVNTFSEECSPEVEQAIPICIEKILQLIK